MRPNPNSKKTRAMKLLQSAKQMFAQHFPAVAAKLGAIAESGEPLSRAEEAKLHRVMYGNRPKGGPPHSTNPNRPRKRKRPGPTSKGRRRLIEQRNRRA